MRKIDIVHLFIYLMIFIVLSNWYINLIIVNIIGIVNVIMFIIYINLVFKNRKLNKKLKGLIKNGKN